MHAGETRQADNLLASKSPLGWVGFGGQPEQTSETTRILHVTYASPIDLRDFCATEAMGVTVKACVCNADKLTQTKREEFKLLDESCIKVDSQWMIAYPLAMKRLESTERRLKRNQWQWQVRVREISMFTASCGEVWKQAEIETCMLR